MIASLQMAVLEWTANAGATDDVTFFIIKALKEQIAKRGRRFDLPRC